MVTVTAIFSSGGITETDTMDVIITNVVTIPFTEQMLSGMVFFEDIFPAGGGYESYLFYHNADFTYETDWFRSDGATIDSGQETGTWSIGASDELILNYDTGFIPWTKGAALGLPPFFFSPFPPRRPSSNYSHIGRIVVFLRGGTGVL